MIKRYFINEQEIQYNPIPFSHGEEGYLYVTNDQKLMKIFKKMRRSNISPVSFNLYQRMSKLQTKRFYLPNEMVLDEENILVGVLMDQFQKPEIASHAQNANIEKIIHEIELVEEDTILLSENGILIHDMKLPHILYNSTPELGIIDFSLYKECDRKDLLIQNLKEMNYYLRQALLWADIEGKKHEMCGIDFPEIYDELDQGTIRLSEVLKSEVEKYKVNTTGQLKKQYQKMNFY